MTVYEQDWHADSIFTYFWFFHLFVKLSMLSHFQVRAGCFSEIASGSLPSHPLLNYVFNSLQVYQSPSGLLNFRCHLIDVLIILTCSQKKKGRAIGIHWQSKVFANNLFFIFSGFIVFWSGCWSSCRACEPPWGKFAFGIMSVHIGQVGIVPDCN